MDQLIDDLLREERVFDTILPRIVKRHVLIENGTLDARVSLLQDELDNEDMDVMSDDEEIDGERRRSRERRKRRRDPSRTPSPDVRDKESLSIEETNALRAKLGLKPLQ